MTDPAPTLRLIPLARIDDAALPRDRTGLDAEPLAELERSIAASGLRQPIEVFPLPEPQGAARFGLLSGFRRFRAVAALHAAETEAGRPAPRFAAIPAFIRPATALAGALAAMVEENEIRADLSPFERGLIAVRARNAGAWPTLDAAVDGLYPSATKQKRHRLRMLAQVAEEMDGQFAAPERITQAQAFRIARALSAGFGDLIRTALEESSLKDPAHQWDLVLPILAEAEDWARRPEPATPRPPPPHPAPPLRADHPPRAHPRRLVPPLHRPRGDGADDGSGAGRGGADVLALE